VALPVGVTMFAETSAHAFLNVATTLGSEGYIQGETALPVASSMIAQGALAASPYVLQQVSGSNTTGFGMGTEAMSTQDGSFLVCYVGWDTTNTSVSLTEPPSPAPVVPVVNVTDSNGNMWQQLGITVSEGYSARCAIWACANAAPVEWVSVATTGFAASVAWTFAEIAYMPQAIAIDFSSGDTTAPLAVNQLSLVGEATGAVTAGFPVEDEAGGAILDEGGGDIEDQTSSPGNDIVFTMLAMPVTATLDPSVTQGPAGFSALDPVTAGASGGSGIAIYPYWATGITAGEVEASYTTSTADVLAGVVCGIPAGTAPPMQPNLNFPLITMEAAFGAQPGDPTKSVDYLVDNEGIFWTDISGRVFGERDRARISCSRGRQYELAQQEAGTLTAYLNNLDGAFTPGNTASPYYSNALNENMSFELGVSPWTPLNGSAIQQSSTYAYTGNYSLQVTPDGVTSNPGASSELADITGTAGRIGSQQAASQIFVTSGEWQAPAGITSVSVECWGAGGGGGGSDATASSAGGGGGGGEYAKDTVGVSSGSSYSYTVGAPGTGGNGSGTETITLTFLGSTIWTAPAGVTSVNVQAWGAGGNGAAASGSGDTAIGGGGGGGGEYAAQNSIAVTPAQSYNVNVGTTGAASSSFTGNSVTVTAHGGKNASGATPGAGGSGSTNTTHYSGGAGGAGEYYQSGDSDSDTFYGGSGGGSQSNTITVSSTLNDAGAGVTSMSVSMGGGGGGGQGGGAGSAGDGGSGGGGGGLAAGVISVSPGQNITAYVGNGGNGGGSGGPGSTPGGTSSIGSISAGGGGNGLLLTGGYGGSASGSTAIGGSPGGSGAKQGGTQWGGGGGGGGGGGDNGAGGIAGPGTPGGAGRNPGAGGGNGSGGGFGSEPENAGNNTEGGDGHDGNGEAGGGGGGGGGANNNTSGADGGSGGAGWLSYSYSNLLNTPIGGGGGGSAAPSGAGNAGQSSTDTSTGGAGGLALANGGAGGNGGVSGTPSQAGSAPGGGGGGSATTTVSPGAGGQVIITYVTTTTVSSGTAGGSTVFTGDSLAVTAHGGSGGTEGTSGSQGAGGSGGSGSSNSEHFSGGGGAAGVGASGYGGGGGGSGGTATAGNAGSGDAGAVAVTGGAPGGNGALVSTGGIDNPPVTPGVAGGGGGGGAVNSTFEAAAAGAPGQIRLTYTPSGTVSASAWFYVPDGWAAGAQVNIAWYNSSQQLISSTDGPVTPIPAGAWTQVLSVNVSTAPGSAYAVIQPQLSGTPAATVVFWVDEAAIVAGTAAVQTGLVRLETPVRLTAWWQGRQFPVWQGYIERFPQEWPDLPQWGFSNITAVDAVSVASAVAMYSAVQGELIADQPYAYIPCNEQYTSAQEGPTVAYTPLDANGLIALNYAPGNQTPGVYGDGLNAQVNTGQAVNLLGDQNTGMGTSGYQVQDSADRGPGMTYYDPSLPTNSSGSGMTVEFWFGYDGATQECTLLTLYGPPSAFKAPALSGNGAFAYVLINGLAGTITVHGPGNQELTFSVVLNADLPQQVVLVMSAANGTTQVYFNGALQGSVTLGVAPQVFAAVLGPGRYSYDCANAYSYESFNYTAAHLAVYGYQLTALRIAAHYNTGYSGSSGVSAAQRFAQILSWGQLGLKRGYYWWQGTQPQNRPEITAIGPAYDLNGSSAADAVHQVEQEEGGQSYVQANGSYIYAERWGTYNLSSQATFGDISLPAAGVLTPQVTFTGGLGTWTVNSASCALTLSAEQVYYGTQSALITPVGGGLAFAAVNSASFPVSAGAAYLAQAWVWSATGWADMIAGCDWYDVNGNYLSTSYENASAPAGAWAYVSSVVTAPAGAASAQMRAGMANSPIALNYMYLSYAAVISVAPQIPYQQDSSFDYDNSYLYTEVQTTQQSGPNQLIVADQRDLTSIELYFRRSALSFTSEAVSPYDISDLTTWTLAKYGTPNMHLSSLTVDAGATPWSSLAYILHLDIGDVVTVTRSPLGGYPITETCIIERVEHQIGATMWKTTYQMSPYVQPGAVQTLDGTNNVPGTGNLGW
jgi:hypothetical protein